MGQVTASTIKMVRAALERRESPPLTKWEYEQLCQAWERVQAPTAPAGAQATIRNQLAYIAAYDLDELDGLNKNRLLNRTRAIINGARRALAEQAAPKGGQS